MNGGQIGRQRWIRRKVVCPERSEPPKAGANGLRKVGAEGGHYNCCKPIDSYGVRKFLTPPHPSGLGIRDWNDKCNWYLRESEEVLIFTIIYWG